MRSRPYTEDQLVEQPAIAMFGALGWRTISARQETLGPGGTLGRETKGEVVLAGRLRAALERFNPTIPPEGIAAAIEQLTRDRSAMSLEAANREIYEMLKHGVEVSVPNHEEGGQRNERLRVVDWEDPAQNDFLLVSQLTIVGSLYPCRPDLVGFVNGLPFVVAELKNVGVPARTASTTTLPTTRRRSPRCFGTTPS
ncbi:MAG: HsdR family type I site-specific deoxyribonuclease [Chlorobi bacterium OLB7]|nr:MAG: HsdR family type I site-specific deoxyribonuclease [Chlorobi bacterium OLB7]